MNDCERHLEGSIIRENSLNLGSFCEVRVNGERSTVCSVDGLELNNGYASLAFLGYGVLIERAKCFNGLPLQLWVFIGDSVFNFPPLRSSALVEDGIRVCAR